MPLTPLPVEWTPFLIIRVVLQVVLLLYLCRASYMRFWHWYDHRTDRGGAIKLISEDRLIRVGLKWIMWCAGLGLLYARFFSVSLADRVAIGDVMISIAAVCLFGLLLVDDIYGRKIARGG